MPNSVLISNVISNPRINRYTACEITNIAAGAGAGDSGGETTVSKRPTLVPAQFRADVTKTQELLRTAVKRSPLVTVPVAWERGEDDSVAAQGPDLPLPKAQ